MTYARFLKEHLPEPVGILGFGVEGKSTYAFLKKHGFRNLVILDREEQGHDREESSFFTGEGYLSHLSEVKSLVRSAGIRPDLPEINSFREKGGRVSSQLEILLEIYPREKVIGVTGTLGKGTTCSLLYEMLERGGRTCLLGGNIGIPMLDLLDESHGLNALIILELSSFQLSSLKTSPGIAVVLKTTEEHLDWHSDKAEYWNHKANIGRFQKPDDTLIFYGEDAGSRYISELSPAKKLRIGHQGDVSFNDQGWTLGIHHVPLSSHKLKGSFNLQNIAAAACAAKILGIEESTIIKAAQNFKGLKHRLEFLGQTSSLEFYNDSYATRPDATLGALNSFAGQKIGLILGGSDKKTDFSGLCRGISESPNITHISFIGQTGSRLRQLIAEWDVQGRIKKKECSSLYEATDWLTRNLTRGIILLSPACASFGMFRNYQHRGEEFKEIVYAYLYSHS